MAKRKEVRVTSTPYVITRLAVSQELKAQIEKDLKVLMREPGYWLTLLFLLVPLGILAMALNSSELSVTFAGSYKLWYLAGLLYFMSTPVALNLFGLEGGSARALFLMPVPRRSILVAKGISTLLVLSIFNATGMVLSSVIARDFSSALPAFLAVESALLVATGVGNVSSVLFPQPLVVGRRGPYARPSPGSLMNVLYLFPGMILTFLLATPAFLSPLIIDLVELPLAFLPAFLFSFIYALGVYFALLRVGGGVLSRHEAYLMSKLEVVD